MTEFSTVVYRLALIQIASDAGKGIVRKSLVSLVAEGDAKKAIRLGYRAKDIGLHQLIGYLSRHQVPGVTFHVNYDPRRWRGSLTYFNIKLNGKFYQVSFHSPFDENLQPMRGKSEAHWVMETANGNRRDGVMDSAETLVYLLKELSH